MKIEPINKQQLEARKGFLMDLMSLITQYELKGLTPVNAVGSSLMMLTGFSMDKLGFEEGLRFVNERVKEGADLYKDSTQKEKL